MTIPWGRFLPCWHLYVGYVCYIYYTRMTCYAWKLWPDNNNASTNISVPWKYFQISIISLGLRYSITKFISTELTNSFTSYYNSQGRPVENLVPSFPRNGPNVALMYIMFTYWILTRPGMLIIEILWFPLPRTDSRDESDLMTNCHI